MNRTIKERKFSCYSIIERLVLIMTLIVRIACYKKNYLYWSIENYCNVNKNNCNSTKVLKTILYDLTWVDSTVSPTLCYYILLNPSHISHNFICKTKNIFKYSCLALKSQALIKMKVRTILSWDETLFLEFSQSFILLWFH